MDQSANSLLQHPKRRSSIANFDARRIRDDFEVDERELVSFLFGLDLSLESRLLALIGCGQDDEIPED